MQILRIYRPQVSRSAIQSLRSESTAGQQGTIFNLLNELKILNDDPKKQDGSSKLKGKADDSSQSSQDLDSADQDPAANAVTNQPVQRRFYQRQLIAPHLLTPKLMAEGSSTHQPKRPTLGPSRLQARSSDPFLALGINPLDEPMNTQILQPFLTSLGRIQGRNLTGLGRKSQRRVGKAVRRARSMGLLPYFGSLQSRDSQFRS